MCFTTIIHIIILKYYLLYIYVYTHIHHILNVNLPLKKKKQYWSGLPFPTPGNLPDPGIEPTALATPALASRFFTTAPHGQPGAGVTVNNFIAFLDMKRCKNWAHKIS